MKDSLSPEQTSAKRGWEEHRQDCHCDSDNLASSQSGKGHQLKKNPAIFGMVTPLLHCCVRLLCAGSLDQEKKEW